MVVADTVTSMSRISVVAFMMLFKRKTPPLDRLSKDTAIKICREIDDEKTISRLHYISGSQTLSP